MITAPRLPVTARAIWIATSFASLPELTNMTTESSLGKQRGEAVGVGRDLVDEVARVGRQSPRLRASAAVTRGWACPTCGTLL